MAIDRFYELKNSEGRVDGSLLLSVLDEIRSVLKRGEKSLEFITTVIHDIIEVSVDLEIINDDVFEGISVVSSLVLESIPGDSKRRESLVSICDTFMVLLDISQSSKRRFPYRDLILRESHEPLINTILNLSISRDVELIGVALRCLNSLLTNSTVNLRRQIAAAKASEIPKLFNLLSQVGDYDIQVSAVETIFRLLPQKEQQREHLSSWLLPFGEEVVDSFLEIQRKSFDVDVRNFLVKINKVFSVDFKVHSIPCLRIEVSGLPLYKPRDENYNEFWVDFNEGSKCIFINCLQSDEETDASWDSLTIKAGSTLSVTMKKSKSVTQLDFKLINSANSYFDSSTAIAFEGKEVEIFFDPKYELDGILRKIFGKKLLGECLPSSPPRAAMFDRRKEVMYDRIKEKKGNEALKLLEEGRGPPMFVDVSPITTRELQEHPSSVIMGLEKSQGSTAVDPLPKSTEENNTAIQEKERAIQMDPPVITNDQTTNMDQSNKKKVASHRTAKAPKSKRPNKRKLFNETHNFMESDSEPQEMKKPKKNSKPTTTRKAKKGDKFLESTPVCKGKAEKSVIEFPCEVSAIEGKAKSMNKKSNLRDTKKVVSYAEDDSLEDSHSFQQKKKKKKSDSGIHAASVYDVDSSSPAPPKFKKDPKLLTYGYRKKNHCRPNAHSFYNTTMEVEVLRDAAPDGDPPLEAHISSPEISLRDMKLLSKRNARRQSSRSSDLPEFQPSGEEVDTNKDSGIYTSMPSREFSKSPEKSTKARSDAQQGNETRLILEKLESLEASYKLRTEFLEDLLCLKSSFNDSINALISKVKKLS